MSSRRTTAAGGGAAMIAAIALLTPYIQKWEGVKNLPYHDTAGVLSVCDGHTGPDVRPRQYYSDAQCAALTEQDLKKAATGVLFYSPTLEKHPMQLAAVISFSYNVGIGTYAKSSARKEFDAGNLQAGCSDLTKYVYAAGKYSDGLYNRRKAEYTICVSDLKGKANVSVATTTTH